MNRREWLQRSAALGAVAAAPASLAAGLAAPASVPALKAPAQSGVPVAFLVSDGAVVIDFCGPWEVFQDVSVPGREAPAFRLYTVAEALEPIVTSGGMKLVPEYTFDTVPQPSVIVIPAQRGRSAATLEWIRRASRTADLTLSVCTGAFLLARTGLLSGKTATTHHDSFRTFAIEFPDVHLKRGARFVEEGNLATAGGLSSGIDLALRVVERYYGRDVATATAYAMEYQGQGWQNPDSNAVYAQARISSDSHPLCPVCEMDVDPNSAPKSVYKGKTYYFCSGAHKTTFDEAPDRILAAINK
jgi:putative intracellular protease/amidase/YHS domain-containing protein